MIGKLAELMIFGLGPLVAGGLLMPLAFADEKATISGEVTYRERIALPPQAILTVQLSDISLADAPAAVVAEQVIRRVGQVPISFELSFDPGAIQPKQTYAITARITVDDTLWFINGERYQVDPLKPVPQKLVLTRAGG